MGNRAVSPVLGMVILAGLVVIVGISVLAVGLAVLGGAQSTAETSQAETSMAEFADTASQVAESDATSGQFALSGPDSGSALVNDSAGRVRIAVHNGTAVTNVTDEDLGAYRYETQSGAEIAYQGGGVWRYEDGEPRMVEPPAFQYRTDPEPTLTFPLVRITGQSADAGSVDGELSVVERRSLTDELSSPITGDYVTIDIESRYCEGWERHVEHRTEGIVDESCGSDDRLRVNATVPEVQVNTTKNTTRTKRTTTINGTYGLYGEESIEINEAGGFVDGSLGSGGNISVPEDDINVSGEQREQVDVERDPHDDAIADLEPENDTVYEEFCSSSHDTSCTYTANRSQPIYVDDFNDGASEVTFDVQDGNITLFVDDGFRTDDWTQWTVENHESGGSVQVYTDGDMQFNGSVEMGTAPDPKPSIPPADADAEALQFYGTSNSDIVMTNAFHVEATISAPSGTTGNRSQVFDTSSASVEFIGALHAGEISITSSSPRVYQDPDVVSKELVTNVTTVTETTNRTKTLTDDEDLYYLHVSETLLEVED